MGMWGVEEDDYGRVKQGFHLLLQLKGHGFPKIARASARRNCRTWPKPFRTIFFWKHVFFFCGTLD